MKRRVPTLKTDVDAEAFLEQDLSDLDFSKFTTVHFEFEPKTERVSMRLPKSLLTAVKAKASAQGRPARLYRYKENAVTEVKARRLFP